MPEHHDPIEGLREAWSGLAAPASARSLGEEDEATREAVQWMQSAWANLEAPSAAPPRRSLARVVPPPRRRVSPFRLAAAAALLFAAAGSLLLVAPRPGSQTGDGVEATAPTVPEVPDAPSPDPTPRLLSADADRIVMKAGPVRLTLLTPPEADSGSTEES